MEAISFHWKILTEDKEILSIVKGYKIIFLWIPHHVKTPGPVHMTKTKAQTKKAKSINCWKRAPSRRQKIPQGN